MRSPVHLMQRVVRVRDVPGSSPGTPTFLYHCPHGYPILRAVRTVVPQPTPGAPYRSTQGLFLWWFKIRGEISTERRQRLRAQEAAGALVAGYVPAVSGAGAVGRGRKSQSRIPGDELEAVTAQNGLHTQSGV